MAVDLGSVGSVYVDVGADLSGLTSQLSEISAQAEALGEQAGASIGEGITAGLSGTEGASEGLASVTNAIHETEGAAEEAVPAFEGMNESLISMAEAFGVVLVGEEVLTMFREGLSRILWMLTVTCNSFLALSRRSPGTRTRRKVFSARSRPSRRVRSSLSLISHRLRRRWPRSAWRPRTSFQHSKRLAMPRWSLATAWMR